MMLCIDGPALRLAGLYLGDCFINCALLLIE